MTKNVLAVVAARGGSKGVPRKNLFPLVAGEPLVVTALKKALNTEEIHRVICITDDAEIAEVAREAGAEVPFAQPPALALDHVPLTEVSQYALWKMDELGFRADVLVQLQATCPFMRRSHYSVAISAALEDRCEVAAGLRRVEHDHPYRARVVDSDGYFSNFITHLPVETFHTRQELPTLYCTSGGLYVRQRHLLDAYDGSTFALGKRRLGVVLDDVEAINIDRQIDLDFAGFMLSTGRVSEDYLR